MQKGIPHQNLKKKKKLPDIQSKKVEPTQLLDMKPMSGV